jgi:hypothetical protein
VINSKPRSGCSTVAMSFSRFTPDRLARDTGDLLNIAKRVVERGAVLRIDDPKIVFDGTDMMAEVMLTLLA